MADETNTGAAASANTITQATPQPVIEGDGAPVTPVTPPASTPSSNVSATPSPDASSTPDAPKPDASATTTPPASATPPAPTVEDVFAAIETPTLPSGADVAAQALGSVADLQMRAELAAADLAKLEPILNKQLRIEDFDANEKYINAVTEQAVARARAEIHRSTFAQAQQAAEAAGKAAWDARTADFRQKVPDFDAVAHNPNLAITPVMADAMRQSDLGGEVAYYLGKNPSEAMRIARLNLVGQVRALVALESRITKAQDAAKAKKASAAPTPAETTPKGGGVASKSLDDMGFEEYAKARGYAL